MNRRPTAIIPLATIEADLLRRGMDPDFVAAKQTIPGDLPPTVSRTEFLALQVRYGYQKAVAVIRARIELAELERELRATSQSASAMRTALDAARVGELGQAFRETAENNIRASFLRGAREGERELRQVEVRIRFDAMNPHAATFARTQSSQLITQIDDSQREAVRNLIETSVSNGRTIQDIARDIRHVVGLRDDQVTALSNYRERITERGRFTVDQIESKVRRYADALLRQRGELIARTEVLHAANQGQLETWMEAQRQGVLGNDWRKKWVLTPDELLCESCEAMEDEVAELDEGFENELGETAMVPPLHPNCRCSLVLTKEAATERAVVVSMQKYSDDQPRVPAGSPDGGQFAPTDGGGDTFSDSPISSGEREAAQLKPPKLSQQERAALANYQDIGYHDINGYLREGPIGYAPEEVQRQVIRLDKLIRERGVTLTKDIIVYRGLDKEDFAEVEKGYFSSSSKLESAAFFGDSVLRALVPAGTKVLPIGAGKEAEILLPRGAQLAIQTSPALTTTLRGRSVGVYNTKLSY